MFNSIGKKNRKNITRQNINNCYTNDMDNMQQSGSKEKEITPGFHVEIKHREEF